MIKYSDNIEDFKQLFDIEYNKIKKFKIIKQYIEDYEIDINDDPLYALNHLMLYAIDDIFKVLKLKVYDFERSGSNKDSSGEFCHYFIKSSDSSYYEVVFSIDNEDESKEFYEMHLVQPYKVEITKFKRL